MGRAMLIIVAGVMLSVGITQSGLQDRVREMTRHGVQYAEQVRASNIAHAGLQLTIHKLMQDPEDCENFYSENNPPPYNLDGGEAHVICDIEDDSAEEWIYILQSTGTADESSHTITGRYQVRQLHFVPTFDSAIKITMTPFEFDIDGAAAEIHGEDPTETGECGDKPGITYPSSEDSTKIVPYESQITGSPPHHSNPETSFDEAEELIQRLEGQPGTVILNNDTPNMGTEDDPGVFMVDGPVKLTGGVSEGWGILIIKQNAEMDINDPEYEAPELGLGGNFTFNGLVIFENATSLSAKGTPSINGSTLIGQTNDGLGSMNIDFAGNVNIQYDCTAQQYAEQAAANVHEAGWNFTALSIFE
ncbi:MAG: hypothetical protein WD035_01700 [Balneolaceae bacterium]